MVIADGAKRNPGGDLETAEPRQDKDKFTRMIFSNQNAELQYLEELLRSQLRVRADKKVMEPVEQYFYENDIFYLKDQKEQYEKESKSGNISPASKKKPIELKRAYSPPWETSAPKAPAKLRPLPGAVPKPKKRIVASRRSSRAGTRARRKNGAPSKQQDNNAMEVESHVVEDPPSYPFAKAPPPALELKVIQSDEGNDGTRYQSPSGSVRSSRSGRSKPSRSRTTSLGGVDHSRPNSRIGSPLTVPKAKKHANYSQGFKVIRCTPTVQNPFPPGAQHGLLTPRSEFGDSDDMLTPRGASMLTPRSKGKKKWKKKKGKKKVVINDKHADAENASNEGGDGRSSPPRAGDEVTASDMEVGSSDMTYEVQIHIVEALGVRHDSNSYCILQVNTRRAVSQIAYRSENPKWMEQFFFVFDKLDWPCRVVVRSKIIDQPLDEFLGELSFNLADWLDYDESGSVTVDDNGVTRIDKTVPLEKRNKQHSDLDPPIHIQESLQTLFNGLSVHEPDQNAKYEEMAQWKYGFKRRLDASLSNYKRSRAQSIVAQHPEFFKGSVLLPGLFGVKADTGKGKKKKKRKASSASKGSNHGGNGDGGGGDADGGGNDNSMADESGSDDDGEESHGESETSDEVRRKTPCWIRWNAEAVKKKHKAMEAEERLAKEDESHSPLKVPNKPFTFYTKEKEQILHLRKTYPGIAKEPSITMPHIGGIMKPKQLAPLKRKHAVPDDRPTMRWTDVMGEIKKPSRRRRGLAAHASRKDKMVEEENELIITKEGLTFHWPHGPAGVEPVYIADEAPSPRGGNPRGMTNL